MLQTQNSTFPESVQFCSHTTCFYEYLEKADSACMLHALQCSCIVDKSQMLWLELYYTCHTAQYQHHFSQNFMKQSMYWNTFYIV